MVTKMERKLLKKENTGTLNRQELAVSAIWLVFSAVMILVAVTSGSGSSAVQIAGLEF